MNKLEWFKRKKQWDTFNAWQAGQSHIPANEAVRLVGEVVDFYLKLNPAAGRQQPLPADFGQNIINLHRGLAVLK